MPSLKQRTALAPVLTATPRAERLASQLAELNAQIKTLTEQKTEIQTRFCKELRTNGVEDEKGKLRMESENAKMVLIQAESSTIDRATLIAQGVSVKVIKKATRHTPYEYVGVYAKGEAVGKKQRGERP